MPARPPRPRGRDRGQPGAQPGPTVVVAPFRGHRGPHRCQGRIQPAHRLVQLAEHGPAGGLEFGDVAVGGVLGRRFERGQNGVGALAHGRDAGDREAQPGELTARARGGEEPVRRGHGVAADLVHPAGVDQSGDPLGGEGGGEVVRLGATRSPATRVHAGQAGDRRGYRGVCPARPPVAGRPDQQYGGDPRLAPDGEPGLLGRVQGGIRRVRRLVHRTPRQLGEHVGPKLTVAGVDPGVRGEQGLGDGLLARATGRPGQLDAQPPPRRPRHQFDARVAPPPEAVEQVARDLPAVAEQVPPVQQPARRRHPGRRIVRGVQRQLGERHREIGPLPPQRRCRPDELQRSGGVEGRVETLRAHRVHIASRPAVAHYRDGTAMPTTRPEPDRPSVACAAVSHE